MLACVGVCVCEVGWEGDYPRGYTAVMLQVSLPRTLWTVPAQGSSSHLYWGPGAL